jgi:hypothetical protein
MGSQKVPAMVVLHCNGRIYGNAFQSRALAHALASSILPLLEAPGEGFFWDFPEFGRRIHSARDPESTVIG